MSFYSEDSPSDTRSPTTPTMFWPTASPILQILPPSNENHTGYSTPLHSPFQNHHHDVHQQFNPFPQSFPTNIFPLHLENDTENLTFHHNNHHSQRPMDNTVPAIVITETNEMNAQNSATSSPMAHSNHRNIGNGSGNSGSNDSSGYSYMGNTPRRSSGGGQIMSRGYRTYSPMTFTMKF
jgi:hypothetical protein